MTRRTSLIFLKTLQWLPTALRTQSKLLTMINTASHHHVPYLLV